MWSSCLYQEKKKQNKKHTAAAFSGQRQHEEIYFFVFHVFMNPEAEWNSLMEGRNKHFRAFKFFQKVKVTEKLKIQK